MIDWSINYWLYYISLLSIFVKRTCLWHLLLSLCFLHYFLSLLSGHASEAIIHHLVQTSNFTYAQFVYYKRKYMKIKVENYTIRWRVCTHLRMDSTMSQFPHWMSVCRWLPISHYVNAQLFSYHKLSSIVWSGTTKRTNCVQHGNHDDRIWFFGANTRECFFYFSFKLFVTSCTNNVLRLL